MNKIFLAYNIITIGAKFVDKESDNAGYDLYINQQNETSNIVIYPGEIIKIPTGIRLAIQNGYYGEIKERGSTGSKGIAVRAGVVDCNYRGEIIVVINNTTDKIIEHDITKAIAQIVIQKYETCVSVECSNEHFERLITSRGDKGFGSTDKQ